MRSQLDSAVIEYSHLVIEKEWPQMADNTFSGGKVGAHELWATVLAYHTADSREQMLLDKSIDQLNLVSQARGERLLYYGEDLPSVVWMVIYLGC